MTDICRLMIVCETPAEVRHVFDKIIVPHGEDIQILRLKPRFNTFLQDMIVNFNFRGYCICELQIKIGVMEPRGMDEQHFVYEALRTAMSQSVGHLTDCVTRRVN
jgi:hypothetical protein